MMDQTIVGAAVSALVTVVTKELIAACKSKAVEEPKVYGSLMKLHSSYEKIVQKMMDSRLDNPVLSQCWHDLFMCWYDTEDLIDHLTLTYSIKDQDRGPRLPLRLGETSNHGRRIGALHFQKQLDKLGLQLKDLLSAAQEPMQQRQISSVTSDYLGGLRDTTPYVGGTIRDKDKESIICKLTSHHRGVSIVGMDGLGKTTLARTVASDGAITSHFSPILYASVSDEFKMDKIVQKLVPSPDTTGTETGKEQNAAKLIELLQGPGNALILLDDLSKVTDGVWDKFKSKYLNPHPRTRILTTTRNPKVAKVTGSAAHYLDQLKDADCEKIMKEKAYESPFVKDEVWNKDIMDIATKCMGMPLTASKIGLTLGSERTHDEFRSKIHELKNKDLWDLDEFREILPCFKLNEPELSPHLKRCFAYCSLFSPEHKFSRDELVQLWQVEGFQQMESQSFDDLLQRSVFHPLGSCSDDKGVLYKMPGLSYRFAQILASKVFLRMDDGQGRTNFSPGEYTRHVSFARKKVDDDLTKHLSRCEGLRTFLIPHQGKPIQRPVDPSLFQKHERLRLLDLSHTIFMEPPQLKDKIQNFCPSRLYKSPSHFNHLRYLDLSGNQQLEKWPKRVPINRLRALQVFILEDCPKLRELPADLCELVRLTHLKVNMKSLLRVPPSLGKLTKLEVLTSYKVQKEQAKVSELGHMEHLTEICIYGVNQIVDYEEAIESKLLNKKTLQRLTLEWDDNKIYTHERTVAREVLEGLIPSSDLKDLTVQNYIGNMFPAWFSFNSMKLESICLQKCDYCEVLPSLGKLPLLRTLALKSFATLKQVHRDFCTGDRGFPSLESLEFDYMSKLLRWTEIEKGNMPRLQSLKINDCPSLLELPSLKHLGSLVNLVIDSAPRLESLPELPSSMNGENVQFILANCPVVKEKCKIGGDDWGKIKDIRVKEYIL